jgi:hypothetical protein
LPRNSGEIGCFPMFALLARGSSDGFALVTMYG